MATRREAKKPKKTVAQDEPRIGLFVEGVVHLTPRGRDDLAELWRHQCGALSAFPKERLDVYGFSKQQILLMDPAHRTMAGAGKVPLDVAIELKYKALPFQTLVVAFDAHPANQAIQLAEGVECPCLREEKDFVLRRLSESVLLPDRFRGAARRLLDHYGAHRSQPRPSKRPPLGDVELIYMDPTFEAAVLQDATALRRVFDLKSAPTTWPSLPYTGDRPDFALREIVNRHRRSGPSYLRQAYDDRKHAWAQEILKNAEAGSAIWQHPIAARMRKVLT